MMRSTLGAVVAVALLGSAGCTQSSSSNGSPQGQASATAATPHEMHGPPGPERLLFVALNRLDLTADQRTKIEAAAHSLTPAMPDQQLFAEVAAGVRAGKIDEARILATIDAKSSPADRSASVVAALDTLHATLTADQRRNFVDMIAEHIDEHEAVTDPSSGPENKLQTVLAKLNLSNGQRASIDKIVATQLVAGGDTEAHTRMAAFHDGLRAKLETFAADKFDAAAFAGAFPTASPAIHDHIQRTLHGLGAILPVLDSGQRETLATMIEARSQHER